MMVISIYVKTYKLSIHCALIDIMIEISLRVGVGSILEDYSILLAWWPSASMVVGYGYLIRNVCTWVSSLIQLDTTSIPLLLTDYWGCGPLLEKNKGNKVKPYK